MREKGRDAIIEAKGGLLSQNRIEGRLLVKSNAESNVEWTACARA
jgi:hypothetical protein